MSQEKKKQHYVPQSYLKRFTDKRGRLCVLDKQKCMVYENQNPYNYAAQNYYYDVEPYELDGILSQYKNIIGDDYERVINDPKCFENYFGRTESEIKYILDKIENDNSMLNIEEYRIKISMFLFDLSIRVDAYRSILERINRKTARAFDELNYNWTDEDAQNKQLSMIADVKFELEIVLDLIQNYNWYLGFSEGNSRFIISDNPASCILMRSVNICIPISPKAAIILEPQEKMATNISSVPINQEPLILSKDKVLIYNSIQFLLSQRFVFGDLESLKYYKETLY